MASWDPTELMLIFAIALIILGPRRLPEIANKIGGWVGKARRMTRVLRRQLEDELDIEKGLNVKPKIQAYVPPNDDDTFSPAHATAGAVKVDTEIETSDDEPEPASDQPDEVPQQESPAADEEVTDEAVTDDDGDRRDS